MEKKVIHAALLGLGTVGTGVYKVLKAQRDEMEAKLGSVVEIKKIMVRNLEKAAAKVDDPSVLTNSWEEIVSDPDIDIIIELIGGIEPARTYILSALESGKHVVSANKDLIAVHGKELLDMAESHQVDFLFEAAVAGGIPIIRPLKQCLAGNHMKEVMGIVNGTTNFILTKMTQEGMEFQEALDLATELGYAEADPTADIEGLDAGRKVAILASVAFNSRVVFDDVYIEGITKITSRDILYAKEMGCDIKLIGMARNTVDGIEAYVCPMLLPSSHPLSSVNDSYNAVFVQGDAVGDAMFYGRGAGELPTASAVVGDVFDIARDIKTNSSARIGCTCYKNIPVKKMADTYSRYFLRLKVEDRCGVLAEMTAVFAKYHVSVAQIIQKETKPGEVAEVVVITGDVREGDFRTAMEELSGRQCVHKISSMLRVYGQ
ncbi:MAG TPA: homoserine dehydrogenase [Candidatus Blautia faecipullorum]|nr:homoserine dehydrogenase [Candidatus Blautia faecipullorum]